MATLLCSSSTFPAHGARATLCLGTAGRTRHTYIPFFMRFLAGFISGFIIGFIMGLPIIFLGIEPADFFISVPFL
jgi:hypothetical protein